MDVVGTFRDGGRASALILVHGFLGSRRLPEIDRAAAALSLDRDTLAIDVLGHGDSPGRFTWGRDEWRQVATAVRRLAEGGREVAVLGFSLGGLHAARAAARGAPIERLVLAGAPADLRILDHFPLRAGFWRSLPAMARRSRRWPRLAPLPSRPDAGIPDEELRRVSCPTLVIHGGGDWLVSRRHAERYAAAIPRCRLLEIPGGFHAEYLMDSSPGAFLSAVSEFLRRGA